MCRTQPGFYVFDLGSTHGTWLNKDKIRPRVYYRLRIGQMVRFGGSSRQFVLQVCLVIVVCLLLFTCCPTCYWSFVTCCCPLSLYGVMYIWWYFPQLWSVVVQCTDKEVLSHQGCIEGGWGGGGTGLSSPPPPHPLSGSDSSLVTKPWPLYITFNILFPSPFNLPPLKTSPNTTTPYISKACSVTECCYLSSEN